MPKRKRGGAKNQDRGWGALAWKTVQVEEGGLGDADDCFAFTVEEIDGSEYVMEKDAVGGYRVKPGPGAGGKDKKSNKAQKQAEKKQQEKKKKKTATMEQDRDTPPAMEEMGAPGEGVEIHEIEYVNDDSSYGVGTAADTEEEEEDTVEQEMDTKAVADADEGQQPKKKKHKKEKKKAGKDGKKPQQQQEGKEVPAKAEEKEEELDLESIKAQLKDWSPQALNGAELHPLLLRNLARQGFSTPTPIQRAALPSALGKGGKDVMGAAETGSGKTLAYGLPILDYLLKERDEAGSGKNKEEKGPLAALIICPTRELALQVTTHLQEMLHGDDRQGRERLNILGIVGGLAETKQARLLGRKPEVIVATVGRFWQLVTTNEPHLRDLGRLRFLVLDEADRMLAEGHYPELTRLLRSVVEQGKSYQREYDEIRRGKKQQQQQLRQKKNQQQQEEGRQEKKRKMEKGKDSVKMEEEEQKESDQEEEEQESEDEEDDDNSSTGSIIISSTTTKEVAGPDEDEEEEGEDDLLGPAEFPTKSLRDVMLEAKRLGVKGLHGLDDEEGEEEEEESDEEEEEEEEDTQIDTKVRMKKPPMQKQSKDKKKKKKGQDDDDEDDDGDDEEVSSNDDDDDDDDDDDLLGPAEVKTKTLKDVLLEAKRLGIEGLHGLEDEEEEEDEEDSDGEDDEYDDIQIGEAMEVGEDDDDEGEEDDGGEKVLEDIQGNLDEVEPPDTPATWREIPPPVVRQTLIFSATLGLTEDDREGKKKNKNKKKKLGKKQKGGGSDVIARIMREVGMRGKPAIIDLSSSNQQRGDGKTGGGPTTTTAAATTTASSSSSSSSNAVALPPGLELCYVKSVGGQKDVYLYYFLRRYTGRSIIFTNSIDQTRRIAQLLTILRLPARALHAKMQQRQRLKSLDQFRSQPNAILVATDVAARGLDIPLVEYVIHYDLPRSLEVFVHRSGRTARAQRQGISFSLVAPRDEKMHADVCRRLLPSPSSCSASEGGGGGTMPVFPVDLQELAAVRERVNLAGKIVGYDQETGKQRASQSWFLKSARDADLELDDELLEDTSLGSEKDRQRALQIAKDRERLAVLLTQPVLQQRKKFVNVAEKLQELERAAESGGRAKAQEVLHQQAMKAKEKQKKQQLR